MNFKTKNNSPEEIERIKLLENLAKKYKIPEFTSEVIVEKRIIPHSHPVLTLNTRKQSDLSVLKTLIHEQFHWWDSRHQNHDKCIAYLKTKYKDDGEHNKSGKHPNSYWGHIIVCFNTRNYFKKILTEDEVKAIYEEWQGYPTLEKKISDNFDVFEKELRQFNMVYNPEQSHAK